LDLGRSGKSHIIRIDREASADTHLSHAGSAEFKTLEIPSFRAAADIAPQILDTISPERDLIDAQAELHRQRGAKCSSPQLRKFSHGRDGRLGCTARTRNHPININLAAGQHALETWIASEF